MAAIDIEQVNKVYPNGFHAVCDLDLAVEDGEFMVLVGPSGCGKTTVLRMVAGLEVISSGAVRIGGRVVNGLSPRERDIAMVFQNYALYPHMTVEQNMAFGLKLRRHPKPEIKSKIGEAAGILALVPWLENRPAQLSGGQRQRVAMGRAIVREPSVFLMDEPLSNLDAKLRVQMRAEVSRIVRKVGVAALYVTHDQVEAMTMGDRVAVLRQGRLQQVAAPQELYDNPVNMFVAAFIGSPAMNLYEAEVVPGGGSVRIGSQTVELPASVTAQHPALAARSGSKVVVGLRPEHLPVANGQPGPELCGDVDLVEALGSELLVHFTTDGQRAQAEGAQTGEVESIGATGEGVARVDPRAPVTIGGRCRFRVDTEQMRFFDPDTGDAV